MAKHTIRPPARAGNCDCGQQVLVVLPLGVFWCCGWLYLVLVLPLRRVRHAGVTWAVQNLRDHRNMHFCLKRNTQPSCGWHRPAGKMLVITRAHTRARPPFQVRCAMLAVRYRHRHGVRACACAAATTAAAAAAAALLLSTNVFPHGMPIGPHMVCCTLQACCMPQALQHHGRCGSSCSAHVPTMHYMGLLRQRMAPRRWC